MSALICVSTTAKLGRITLYGYPTSPYVAKVAGYLGYKKMDYEFVGVNPVSLEQIAFSGQRQVPVLKIGDQWKHDSDAIAAWLDDVSPPRPLLPAMESDRSHVKELNHWVNHTVVPGMFRLAVEWPSVAIGLSNGWKLSKVVGKSVDVPKWVQVLWPVFLRKAKFIKRIVEPLDKSESLETYQQRVLNEFASHRGNGPFLGGRAAPSLADVSLYPLILLSEFLDLKADMPWGESAEVQVWLEHMSQMFDETPLPSVHQVQ